MPDAADALAGAVVGFLDALELENVYDNPHGMATHDRIAAAVITRLVSRKNGTLAPHVADQLRSFSQSLSGSTASSTSSSALAGSEGRHDSPISQRDALPGQRHQARSKPKAINRTRKPHGAHNKPRARQNRPKTVLEALTWRSMTESSEDSATGLENRAVDTQDDETSEDELLHDTPRPAKPTPKPKPKPKARSKPKVKAKSSSTPRLLQAPTSHPEHIDWVFWIHADEVGYWRPLSDFPPNIRTSFVSKFSADFLTKPRHIKQYASMLRNRETYLTRDLCVGNVTYWGRNEPSKWTKTGGDKELTCDTCINRGRLCAGIVMVGSDVKLVFYPLPESSRADVAWNELRYWATDPVMSGP